jgi:diaminohydroxyphosphoribosylaminopyrimidine deaminase/5-amino-6-(5-phosphoribosylamino)uracil reductase
MTRIVPQTAPDSLYDELHTSGSWVLAQLGQSLDGRIATGTGDSHYINGEAALVHLHRLRALADAVLVGAGTVAADNPRLTVRRCPGRNPARVVLDPGGRTDPAASVYAGDGVRRIVFCGQERRWPAGVEAVCLPAGPAGFAPGAVVAALEARGLRKVLVEGGAVTVSRFLAAGCVDRLHVAVAPLLIGDGPTGITLPAVARLADAPRPLCRIFALGGDVLFDCDLRRQGQQIQVADQKLQ